MTDGPLNLLMGEKQSTGSYGTFGTLRSLLSYKMAVIELFTNALFPDDPLSLMIGGPDYSMRENGFDGFREVSCFRHTPTNCSL
jgi:hypothetical protein